MKRNPRLIDANRYHDVLIEVFGLHSGETIPEGLQIAQSALDMQPTVEAVPHEEFLKLEYENMMLRRKLEKATAERDAAIRATEPTRHGEWVVKKSELGTDFTICSNCNTVVKTLRHNVPTIPLDMRNAKYCPSCGAKMEGEKNE